MESLGSYVSLKTSYFYLYMDVEEEWSCFMK